MEQPPPGPGAGPARGPSRPARLLRSRRDRIISGVSGGMGDYFGVDPVLVRIGWVVLTLVSGGTAVLAYLIAWLIIPEVAREPEDGPAPAPRRAGGAGGDAGRLVFGGILIILGAFLLFRLLVPWFFDMQVLGPLILVGIGIAIIAQAARR